MRTLSFLILAAFLLFFFLSRNETVPSKTKESFVLFPFYKIAVCLHHRFLNQKWCKKTGSRSILSKSGKIYAGLCALFPGQAAEKELQQYCFSKLALAFLIIFSGSLLAFLLSFQQNTGLADGNRIIRGFYGEGDREIILGVRGQKRDSKGAVKLKIASRQYTQAELKEFYKEFLPLLEKEIMGDNPDKNKIQKDMNLIAELASYPFTVEWRTSDVTLMNYEGRIQKEEIEEKGELLELTAVITYEAFQKIYTCFVRVYPPALSETEQFLKAAEQELQKSNEESRFEQEWKLPEKIAEEYVVWKEQTVSKSILILGMSCLAAVLLYFQRDYDLKKKVKKREQEMLWDYPAIVSRLTLYLNAGMTVKAAWKKAAGAEKRTERERYIYKEMQLTCYEMDSGIPEVDAYERFGKRCALPPYIKMTALLTQNVKKGNRVLLERLKEETQLALLERKNKIRITAEEAGTKLLVPMMLMMAVVMVLIMVPALQSF